MGDVSPGRGSGAPLQPLPAWLSRTSSPTATLDLPYTFATLLPNGVPTLIVTAQRVTQYGTDILQLPLTIDPAADVSGQILGDLYTTPGGDATQTVVRELGGTRMFTLGGGSGTQALAGATTAGVQSAPAAVTAMSAADPSSAASVGAPSASASSPPVTPSPSPTSPSTQASSAPAASVASVAAALSAALASATAASTVDPASVASLSSGYAAATSALSVAYSSSSSAASVTSAPFSSLSPTIPPSLSSSNSASSTSSSSSPALNAAHHLTPSQLAAAIAAPLSFSLLLLLLLLLCCCCLRRRKRRRSTVAEEEELLDSPASTSEPKKRVKSGGVLWEWVPTRSPSRVSGRSGSGRSVLSRLTGGLLGRGGGAGGAGRSMAGSSPQEGTEKGFSPRTTDGGEGRSPRTEEEKGLLSGREGESGRDTAVAAGVAGLAAAGVARQAHPYARNDDLRRYDPVEPFDDIDLTSPRLDLDSPTFPSRPLSPPTLLPIQPSSPIRLSRFYDPTGSLANAYFPPSPSSYSTPSRFVPSSEVPYSNASYAPPVPLAYAEGRGSLPLGPVRQATSTLSQLWQGYETNSPRTDAGLGGLGGDDDEARKRESSRLGCLSLSTREGGAGGGPQQEEYTPPQTPDLPALRVIHEREDDERSYSGSSEGSRPVQGRQALVSEGGWLSGRLSGLFPSTRPSRDTLYEADEEDDGADEERDRLRVPLGVARRGSGDTNASGQSDDFRGLTGGDLFLNSPRWVGTRRRRSSPPPFSSFEPLGSTAVSYDPPIILHHQPSFTSLNPPYRQPRHWSSFATETDSRYHDADSPIFAPTPAESPGLYPSAPMPRVTTIVKGRHQREDSGASVLGRIAAGFGALKGGVAAGLGIEGEGAGAGGARRRGMPRRREFSTESSMDPFQYSYATANLPTVPSPTSSPRKQRTRRSLTTLRHSQSQPMMQKQSSNAPPLPFPSARPLSTVVGRYMDPFADADVDADADDERVRPPRAHQDRREHEYGQARDGPDMVEIRRVGEQSE
ncbi:hypothetical protein OF846_001250 [Rhodotorula toruloides]|nr:hypothetical protein OF846_001250 [Rhodotorula toruloides]